MKILAFFFFSTSHAIKNDHFFWLGCLNFMKFILIFKVVAQNSGTVDTVYPFFLSAVHFYCTTVPFFGELKKMSS